MLWEYINKEYTTHRLIRIEDIDQYQNGTGDLNPIHYNEEVAKNTRFETPIAPGIILMGYMVACIYYTCTLISPKTIPIISSINTTFLSPGYVGDITTSTVRIDDVINKHLDLNIKCEVKNKILCKGNAVIKLIEKKGE